MEDYNRSNKEGLGLIEGTSELPTRGDQVEKKGEVTEKVEKTQ